MDIRRFFQASGPKSGDTTKREKKQEASQPAIAALAPAAAAARSKSKAKATPSPAKVKAKGAAEAAAEGGSSARKRKKKDATDSDSEVVIMSDDADNDSESMSLDAEDHDSDADFVHDSDEDTKLKPSKRAKTSATAAAAAAKPSAAAGAKKSPAGKVASKSPAAKASRKAKGPAMVIEPNQPEPTTSQEGSAKKRKMPGSMAGKAAPVAPKAAKKEKAAQQELSADAAAAIAAVEAAAKKLPELDADNLSFMAEGTGFMGAGVDQEPPALGSKDIPTGHPDAFQGKTFVFSGVLSSLYRDQAKDLVLRHGGRVTGDVSGKTSFLVLGESASNRKYNKAMEKGCKVIDEDGLLALAAASAPTAPAAPAPAAQPSNQQQQPSPRAAVSQPSAAAASGGKGPSVKPVSAVGFHGPSAGSGAPRSAVTAAAASGGAAAAARPSRPGPPRAAGDDALWVDKYKPKSTAELVGNNTLVATLRQWLYAWDAVHIHGATPEPAPGGGAKKDMSKKAVLLSGPPGIGKTSSAHIIAKELGFQVVEVNASDTRSKSDNKAAAGIGGKLSNIVREMVTSNALANASGARRRQVLVMDEVDGMSGGDRGGVADLIHTIKISRIPIICICNDKYSQKLKSLRNHCLELDYRKPTAQQISARMQTVCRAEGLSVNEATLRTLVEGAQEDLRLILGQLQMTRLRSTSMDYNQAKALGAGGKDADMSPFSAASKLLEQRGAGRPPTIGELTELAFADADLVPLLVAENYINHRPDICPQSDMTLRLRCIAKAADAISVSDVVNTSVRRYGNWGLMPFGALMGCVFPAAYMHGYRETFEVYENNFTRFSAWFGQNSHLGKQKRLLAELSCNLAASESGAACGRASVRLDYLPAFRQVLTRPLVNQGEEAIPRVIATMQEYCISREQWDYVLDVTKFKSKAAWAADPTEGLESKVKSAFTRKFNQQGLVPRTNTMVADVVKGRASNGKGKGRAAAGTGEGDELAGEGLAGDAEGGAALAEEAVVQADEGVVKSEEEEEELSPEQLAAQMRGEGIKFEIKQAAAKSGGKSGGRGGSSGRGRGRGASAGGSSRGGASGRGAASGRSRGRGRGK